MDDIQHPADSGARNGSATVMWLRQYLQLPSATTVREFVILFVVTIFLLLYGLVLSRLATINLVEDLA